MIVRETQKRRSTPHTYTHTLTPPQPPLLGFASLTTHKCIEELFALLIHLGNAACLGLEAVAEAKSVGLKERRRSGLAHTMGVDSSRWRVHRELGTLWWSTKRLLSAV